MLNFKDYLKALLPGGSLWQPVEEFLVQNPEPALLDGDMEAGPGPEELVDGDMEDGPGPEELIDGDMEAAGTGAWAPINAAILSKVGSPYEGIQCLRIAYNGSNNPGARQTPPLVNGLSYRIFGWARSDGSKAPRVRDGAGVLLWTGVSTHTDWQYFDISFVSPGTWITLQCVATSAGYSEFDIVSVKETCPAWTPNSDALLTKETAAPQGGLQSLKVEHDGTNHPYASQITTTIGRVYHITGWAHGDGGAVSFPRVNDGGVTLWNGINSVAWQEFDIIYIAASTSIRLYARSNGVGQFCEFDSVSIKETCPDWQTSDALLTKYTILPQGGFQSLRLDYDGVAATPIYALQTLMNIGQEYRLRGYARSGGAIAPFVTDGVNTLFTGDLSTDWQEIDVIFIAAGTELRLLYSPLLAGETIDFDSLTLVATQPATSAHFDLMFEAMGDMKQDMYEFLKALAHIRDPRKTIWLDDLEREYGFLKDLDLTDQERRDQIAALKYAKRGTGSLTDLQNILINAGFNVIVKGNSPAVDPNLETLGISEPIINGSLSDFWVEYYGGLQNPNTWQRLFWICAAESGWPYEYGGEIHSLKNDGTLLLYSDYFTHLPTRDYSKYVDDKLTEQNVIRVKGDGIKFDNFGSLSLIDDGKMEWGPGPQLLVDGNMEHAGVSDWTVGAAATLTKQGAAYEGAQCLRVAYNGTNNPYARQTILTAGVSYRATGWARSDGVYTPRLREPGGTTHWIGTLAVTWQYFDVIFVAGLVNIGLYAGATGAGYCEFDAVEIRETCPAWTAGNSAQLTKEMSALDGDLKCLRVTYNGVNDPRALQVVIGVTKIFRITGFCRGDGTYAPAIYNGAALLFTGTIANDWQYFEVLFLSTSGELRLVALASGAGYCEFDNVAVVDANQQAAYIKEDYHPRFTSDEEFSIICLADFQTQFDGEIIYSKRSLFVMGLELRLSSGPDEIELVDQSTTQSIAHSVAGDACLGVSGSEGNAAECFIDGVSIGNFSGTTDLNTLIADHYIGNNRYGADAFQSVMRGFLYFNRILTDAEHLAIYNELALLTTPEVTAAVLTDTQKSIIRNLTTKFKPVKSWGLLAIEDTDDFKFTFCSVADYPGDAHKGFASTADMRGGRLIDVEEF